MKIIIVAVGSCKKGPHFDLWKHYTCRISPPPLLREIDDDPDSMRKAVKDIGYKIALDEHGTQMATTEMADIIARNALHAVPSTGFIIGGAYGIPKDVLAGCDKTIAFGRCTWPHLLVRGLLAEQLYRIDRIHAGHPYHHA